MSFPLYAWFGLGILAVSEAGMALHVEPFWSFHTPIAWTGYILLIDGIIFRYRKSSWLMTNLREFWFLTVLSIPLWLVFEGYNLLIKNWHYVGLPQNVLARYFGYAWSFATIWPAIFETAELAGVLRGARGKGQGSKARVTISPRLLPLTPYIVSVLTGAVMLLWPIVRPSPHLAAPVFLGFIFLLDPLNNWLGEESLLGDMAGNGQGTFRLVNLSLAGGICGLLWEFWNYWSHAKWIYDVPIMSKIKIFEMPLPGYFGFPPFALECFTMYVFVRHFAWRRRGRHIGV